MRSIKCICCNFESRVRSPILSYGHLRPKHVCTPNLWSYHRKKYGNLHGILFPFLRGLLFITPPDCEKPLREWEENASILRCARRLEDGDNIPTGRKTSSLLGTSPRTESFACE
ncbi:hypothetical protein HAX54_040046 [Datura stramonium]|uniref:Uncharacterized protein n=1 Tax=Datura stramonium TaxID=4076 RepID=A0ABS8SKN9_DATST|nr:hypothetical protein [Datura stramonium]